MIVAPIEQEAAEEMCETGPRNVFRDEKDRRKSLGFELRLAGANHSDCLSVPLGVRFSD